MKTSELKQIIKEEISKILKESSRVRFNGKRVKDLYNIVKNMDNVEVFANNNYYILDIDDLSDPQNANSNIVYLLDDSGESKETKVSDIEFITSSKLY